MSRIVGLSDAKKKDDKKNEYFAGGLDQRGGGSGLAVQGPPRGDDDNTPFRGVVERAMSNQSSAAGAPPSGASGSGTGNEPVTISMYRNGFTVNHGPLRNPTEPENARFIEILEKGQVPPELQKLHTGPPRDLDVRLEDKRSEDYVPPPPPSYIAFGGTGASLGGGPSSSDAFVFSPDVFDGVLPLAVDASQPSTTVQIKFPSGAKPLRVKVNTSSTVLQLAAHINSNGGSGLFSLSSGFPPVDIVDPTQTIAEAGLTGASIVYKSV